MSEIIAYCGLDCSQCPSFQATIKNDTVALESLAKRWPSKGTRITVKDVTCEGCWGKRLSKYCLELCAIRPCAIAKKVKNCAYCDEYKCQKLTDLLQKAPKVAEKLETFRRNLTTRANANFGKEIRT